MSIRSFFKQKDGLPDPKGSLSTCLSSQAIALANKEVEKVTSEKGIGKQRGHTDRERYGAPSHTPVLLQQLPPIFLYIHGSLKCSKVFPTPPCQLLFCQLAWRSWKDFAAFEDRHTLCIATEEGLRGRNVLHSLRVHSCASMLNNICSEYS